MDNQPPEEPASIITPTEQQPQPSDSASSPPPWKSNRKNTIIIAGLILVAILAVGTGYSFWQKHSSRAPNSSSSSKTTATSPVSDDSFYVTTTNSKETKLLKLSYKDGSAQTLASITTSGKSIDGVVQLNTGVDRIFYDTSTTTGNNTTQTLSYQDTGQPEKTILSVTGTPTNEQQFVSGYIDTRGRYVDTMVFSSTSTFVERVAIDGTVTKFQEPSHHLYMPADETSDGKTVYLSSFSCYNCDGPRYADLISLDTQSGQFNTLYSDPNGHEYGGGWNKAGNYFWISSSNIPGLGFPTYDDALKFSSYIYNYNLSTGQTSKVFVASPPNEANANVENVSTDLKKVFVIVQKIKQGDYIPDTKQYGADYEGAELRVYDAATSSYSTISIDNISTIQTVGGTSTNLIYSTEAGQSPDDTISIYKLDLTKQNAPPTRLFVASNGDQVSIIKF